jgi:hypothetical protein
MTKTLIRLSGLAVMMMATVLHSEPVYYFVTTGQQGAQTQIDVNHSSSWTFNVVSDFTLGGGKFEMKDGPQTVQDITLNVWQGSIGGTLYAQKTLTNPQFDTVHGGNPQSYDTTVFLFPLNVTLQGGNTYVVNLTSTAIDAQSKAYFIKGFDRGTFQDDNGNPPPNITESTVNEPGYSPTPEPSTWVTTTLAAAVLGWTRLRRRC